MTAPDARAELPKNQYFGRALSLTLAIVLAVFGFLPIANWIDGGHAASWYGQELQSWLLGVLIIAGLAAVLSILSRHTAVTKATQLAQYAASIYERSPVRMAAVIALLGTICYATVAVLVFDTSPLFIDEIVQMYQARLLANGELVEVVGPFPEFFGALNVINAGDRQFGQFPPGGPAHLALGLLVGAPWLVTPILGGGAVFVFAQLARRFEPESSVALGATVLFAFSPFMLFMSASHMNHVPTLFWVLLAWYATARLTARQDSAPRWALLFGASAGVAAAIRPVDAAALLAPAIAWWMWSARRKPDPVRELLGFGAGALVPIALLLLYNDATTGSPLRFGYDLMWGKSHSLGFHESPWGASHTPARGAELLNLYFLRLQAYLFESPAPSLLPVIATLAFARRRMNSMLLIAFGLLVAAYFAYWHDGFYLGPRFVFIGLPTLALLAAGAPRALRDVSGRESVRRVAFFVFAIAIGVGLAFGAVQRGRLYAHSLPASRHELTAAVDSLGIRQAIVFVRESWGSQVLARLWGREIARPDAELLYRAVDTCVLDSAVTIIERENLRGVAARDKLWPLLVDSAVVQPSALSPDRSERTRSDRPYSDFCMARVRDDHSGITLYPLVLAQLRGSNIYARDLGAHNVVLMQRHPGRAAYVLAPRALDSDEYLLRPFPPAEAAQDR